MTILDGREYVLIIHTYLVDAAVPFLCGMPTLESWSIKIDSKEKISDIQKKTDQDCSKKLIRMVDTVGGHYGIILVTKNKKKSLDILFVEDDTGILFLEDARDDFAPSRQLGRLMN